MKVIAIACIGNIPLCQPNFGEGYDIRIQPPFEARNPWLFFERVTFDRNQRRADCFILNNGEMSSPIKELNIYEVPKSFL